MFNTDKFRIKTVKRQTLSIILILIAGGTSTAFAVTNGSIITGDLTITGTCTGCGGGGEASYTTYSTLLNSTISGTDSTPPTELHISDQGTVLAANAGHVGSIVFLNGTVISTINTLDNNAALKGQLATDQSGTGKYQIILDNTNSVIKVYKSSTLLQNIGYNSTQSITLAADYGGIAISPSGKYIALYTEDGDAFTLDRLVIFGGS